MTMEWREHLKPGVALLEIVQEATAALVSMDANRLEELAICCAELNRDLEGSGETAEVAAALLKESHQLQLLDRVLHETRSNLSVLTRLYVLRLEEIEASRPRIRETRLSSPQLSNDSSRFWKAATDGNN